MKRFIATSALLLSSSALPALAQDGGFVITLNGDKVAGDDPALERQVKKVDEVLEQADVRVQYDGLDVTPRLDLEIEGSDGQRRAGDGVTLQSALNYPGFVTRGEVLIVDQNARGGPKTLGRYDIAPNGQVTVTVPEGDNIVAVHRVYDANGRYDETAPLSLSRGDDRALEDGVEDGNDATARRRIPVHGGAVTVSGSSVAPGAQVTTLGEVVRPDPSGAFVIQRILPPGDYAIGVQVQGTGAVPVDVVREVEVPRSESFYTAQIDLTLGYNDGDLDGSTSYERGRIAGYFNGRYANGVELTAQVDTGEGDLDEIFSTLGERDPRSTFLRLDPDDLYPTYGDDSTLVDDTPTSGKFYLRVEKDNNYAVWGDWRADIANTTYLRNDRTLYGARGHLESANTTSLGEPVWQLDAYAAQQDTLPQRDVFRGTGGSVYFLSRQDLTIGSETLLVQVRDATTGRVISTQSLVAGRDYSINYIQGIITLSAPLQSGTGSNGLVVTDVGGAADVNLVAQYEFTPDAGDIDAFSYGLRGEVWAADRFRLGATVQSEETGLGTQDSYGLDLRYQLNEDTYLSAEYAWSDGPGFGFDTSTDGGLVFDETPASGGRGDAYKIEGRAALGDLGLAAEGSISAYFEERSAGFTTLDYSTTADETLWGLALDAEVSERLSIALYFDSFKQDGGKTDREGGIEAEYLLTDRVTLGFGLENLDRQGVSGSGDGQRTDAVVRLTYKPNDNLTWYVYGQETLSLSGTLEENDRIGVGGSYRWAETWEIEGELSEGDGGTGGRILLRNDRGEAGNTYFGYELDPSREISGLSRSDTGRSRGRFITGGERRVSGTVTMFGENAFDRFGRYESLTSAYGVTYEPTERLSFVTAFETGRVRDSVNGDFDRYALSLGAQYQSEQLEAKARLEFRNEDGTRSNSNRNSDTWLFTGSGSYKLDESQRLVFSAKVSDTDGNSGIAPDSDYTDLSLGYAYRPIYNERLNVLLRYRYLDDSFGQQVDGSDTPGPVQQSHVFSVDAEYDINKFWSIGGKVGARFTDSADSVDDEYTSNDAVLAILNTRWHVVNKWDALFELRALDLRDAGVSEVGGLAAIYRHLGKNVKLGVGYNFTNFSDDLTDLTFDDRGAFINIVAKF
ncbi:hypothetical protein [uncultured Tateyamaria sp.]|uniref:hypothetical protein n=1 Tax=uncultured Tateyamaria sp. TaxID=455651 RepID=UPI002625D2AB|nr:hypothetical protein [uncultured Tateyamaria sp.]